MRRWIYGYCVAVYVLLPFAFLRLLWRSRKDKAYRKRWLQRLGFVTSYERRRCIWVHAVSVGETIAAKQLIRGFLQQHPEYGVVVSSMTPSGYTQATALFADHPRVYCCHVPYDTPGAVKRFLSRIQPLCAVIMETEWWPNLWAQTAQRGIPVFVANGRLSACSARAYQRLPVVVHDTLQQLTCYAAQTQEDADRVCALGLPKQRVRVLGNVKFDLQLEPELMDVAQILRAQIGEERAVWVAGSTHEGEEQIVLAAHKILQQQYPDLALILVPRHPKRCDAVAALCSAHRFRVVRRTQQQLHDMTQTDVFLGDTLGEMMIFYAAADIAFVGGSLVPVGGHNLLEPARLSKPVLMGPYLHNFESIGAWLLAANAALCVKNVDQLVDKIASLLRDAVLCRRMGRCGAEVVQGHTGALDRHLQCIDELITSVDVQP